MTKFVFSWAIALLVLLAGCKEGEGVQCTPARDGCKGAGAPCSGNLLCDPSINICAHPRDEKDDLSEPTPCANSCQCKSQLCTATADSRAKKIGNPCTMADGSKSNYCVCD